MPKIDDKTRDHIAAFLPEAVQAAIVSYQSFAEEQATQPQSKVEEGEKEPKATYDAKGFKTHHDACKVAIAHIELLLKLAQWAEIPEEDITKTGLEDVITKVNAELGRHA